MSRNPPSPSRVEERPPRYFGREALYIFGSWTLFGLFAASQVHAFRELRGRPMPWEQVLSISMLEAYLWALITLLIFWQHGACPSEAPDCGYSFRCTPQQQWACPCSAR